jgi:hypothetical protein
MFRRIAGILEKKRLFVFLEGAACRTGKLTRHRACAAKLTQKPTKSRPKQTENILAYRL